MESEEKFLCEHCGKLIEFERPLFCPFCGAKVDPTAGLVTDKDGELEIYRWTRIAPAATRIFVVWLLLLIPVCVIWGRKGFFLLGLFFGTAEIVAFLAGWWNSRSNTEL